MEADRSGSRLCYGRYGARPGGLSGAGAHILGRIFRYLLVLVPCVLVGNTASGQAIGLGLAQAGSCVACHTVEKKRVGPSFTAIAERFAGTEGAEEYLVLSIRNGGANRWGAIPMPAQPQVSEAQARELAKWILSLSGKQERAE